MPVQIRQKTRVRIREIHHEKDLSGNSTNPISCSDKEPVWGQWAGSCWPQWALSADTPPTWWEVTPQLFCKIKGLPWISRQLSKRPGQHRDVKLYIIPVAIENKPYINYFYSCWHMRKHYCGSTRGLPTSQTLISLLTFSLKEMHYFKLLNFPSCAFNDTVAHLLSG